MAGDQQKMESRRVFDGGVSGREELRGALLSVMREFLTAYRRERGLEPLWEEPLLGFAGAGHPYIRSLRTLISPSHYMPEEILPGASVVLSYFVPFARPVGQGNVEGTAPSRQWAEAYVDTNEMFRHMNEALREQLQAWGYHAAWPEKVGKLGEDRLYSNWSQRHLACCAGLGTFGLNNMLITEKGCCGRFYSLVTDLPVLPDEPVKEEYCLFRKNGGCGLCAARCPSGALDAVKGFDRKRCHDHMRDYQNASGERVCGKCVVGMPCSFRAPGRFSGG